VLPGDDALPPTVELVADVTAQTLTLLAHLDTVRAGADSWQTMCAAADDVGAWLYRVGAYLARVTVNETTLAAREQALGLDHLDTLTSRARLARGYRAAGRPQDAITLDEATLAARQRLLGFDHLDTVSSRNNLANGYRGVGRHHEAITLDEATLAARERLLGPDHPDALTSRNNLARDYQAVGRHQDALTLDEATLAARQRVLGSDHPDTLTSRNNLAEVLGQAQGRAFVGWWRRVITPLIRDQSTSGRSSPRRPRP
jgi:tetratricopeptide (TPR) repeat protein